MAAAYLRGQGRAQQAQTPPVVDNADLDQLLKLLECDPGRGATMTASPSRRAVKEGRGRHMRGASAAA